MRILFAHEYGWEAKEIGTVLADIPSVETVKILRSQISSSSLKPENFDLILSYGPHSGSFLPLLGWLKQAEPKYTPKLVWWLNENIPELESWNKTKILGQIRISLDSYMDNQQWLQSNWLKKLGHRYRILQELFYLQQEGIPLFVPTTSKRRSELLVQAGFDAIHVPMGWGPSDALGRDLSLERDIQVIWVGRLPKLRSRRTKIINPLIKNLAQRGVHIECYTKNLTGVKRTEILNRSKILLNILRHSLDFTGHRLILGAANKALLVSEIMVDPTPFEPNKHMVQVAVQKIADTIVYYLENEEERQKIVDNAYGLVMNELTMEKSVKQVLKAVGVIF